MCFACVDSFSVAVCFCMCVFFFCMYKYKCLNMCYCHFYALTCHHNVCMCLHVSSIQIQMYMCTMLHYLLRNFSMPACVLVSVCARVCVCLLCVLRSSFDVCSPRTCSLYTALCSGWSRSGCVVLTVVPSAAVQPGPSPPCQPSSTPRSS